MITLSCASLKEGDTFEKQLIQARLSGATVSLDLADAELVERYRERLWEVLPTRVDHVLGSEAQAYALTGLPPREAAAFLKNFCTVAVVHLEKEGCWVCSKEGLYHSNEAPKSIAAITKD
ncbi:MAG: hypothetical protein S4CHLAM2_09200 [Chlamydiales bacterium]|nr:hypothetical protein [Chlamydiales bacterium]